MVRRRVRVSATIDGELLAAVDAAVEEQPGLDRSKVIEEALRLWYAREQERAMEAQYAAPRSELEERERADWQRIRSAAAERTFRRSS